MKGAINYLREIRDICQPLTSCRECPIEGECPGRMGIPELWTDDDILRMVQAPDLAGNKEQ